MAGIVFPEVARSLFVKRAFEFGGFQLKLHEKRPEDPLSPYKTNFRKAPDGPLDDGDIQSLGALVWMVVVSECEDPNFDSVVGVPKAGDAIAAVVARLMHRPQGFLAKEEHNGRRRIAAYSKEPFLNGMVLLVDDVVTEADSKVEAARAVRYSKGIVWHCGVVLDREQGGREAMARENLTLHSAWRASDLFLFFRDEGLIENFQYQRVVKYLVRCRKHPAIV